MQIERLYLLLLDGLGRAIEAGSVRDLNRLTELLLARISEPDTSERELDALEAFWRRARDRNIPLPTCALSRDFRACLQGLGLYGECSFDSTTTAVVRDRIF